MDGSGTPNQRPTEWGAAITKDWWYKASDGLLRRIIGYGAGDGPPQDQTQRLADGLQILFRASESSDLGEGEVRTFVGSGDESTDQLQIDLNDKLVKFCGPLLARGLAEADGDQTSGNPSPSAAVSNAPSVTSRPGAKGQGATVKRPNPPGQKPNWWQTWIDKQNAKFELERDNRVAIYEACLQTLSPSNVPKFTKLPEVQVNEDYWQGLFQAAVRLSQLAIGIPKGDDDDAYHVPGAELVPGNLRSFWLLGKWCMPSGNSNTCRCRPSATS